MKVYVVTNNFELEIYSSNKDFLVVYGSWVGDFVHVATQKDLERFWIPSPAEQKGCELLRVNLPDENKKAYLILHGAARALYGMQEPVSYF